MTDPHVVVACLDTVRKDFYERFASRLSELATYRFQEMRAASSWSVPSHAAMFGGRLPSETDIHTYNRNFETLGPENTWLGGLDGYRTVAVSANTFASPAFGFDTLFDDCTSISPSCRLPEGIDVNGFIRNNAGEGIVDFIGAALDHPNPLHSVANAVLFKCYEATQGRSIKQPFDFGGAAIARRVRSELNGASEPTFVFANFMDAHSPHTPFRGINDDHHDAPASFTSLNVDEEEINAATDLGGEEAAVEHIRGLYGGAIAYLDNIVADLAIWCQDHLERDTILVITSDHGENLGFPDDDHMIGHTNSLSEGLLHVPFDVIGPVEPGETTVRTSLLDLGQIVKQLRDDDQPRPPGRELVTAEIAGHSADGTSEDLRGVQPARRAAYVGDRKVVWTSDGDRTVYDIGGHRTPSPSSTTEKSIRSESRRRSRYR
ncbi:sulfatase-like hydrolase/transferase [Halomicroarcula sp. GCM10025894]|uniref:sulfatase-like hydrolase/transferase n=1 Tax=Halomicroarcula sp. GCM10025894 TaxID=3252673 RepID=UPI0036118A4E